MTLEPVAAVDLTVTLAVIKKVPPAANTGVWYVPAFTAEVISVAPLKYLIL